MNKNIYIIAEIGQAHEGSLGMVHSYIEALANTGVNAVKFQMHIAEAESSIFEPFRVNFSVEDKTRYDYWHRMGFSLAQWKEIKNKCEQLGLDFICSPFSNLAVDWLEEIGVNIYKIGSGEVNNLLLIEKIARTGKSIILSSGMSSYSELDLTIDFLKTKKLNYSILQCTTSYPTCSENYGLNVIAELKKRYGVVVGYSDHSAKIETAISAVALGAEIIEFHVVFDRQQFGPDSKSSLTIKETKKLVKAIRNIENAFNNPIDKSSSELFSNLKNIFEKSLAINKDLEAGHILTFEDLESKKPKGFGIDASNFQKVIGMKIKTDKLKWSFLQEEDLYD